MAVAITLFAGLMANSTRYGWFRDELYFRSLGKRLSVGFADVPILTPLVARVTSSLFGDSLSLLRVWPALSMMGVVLFSASLCSMFGGSRKAETVTAASVAVSPIALIFGHVYHYAAFDLLAWSAVLWCILRLTQHGSPKWWVAVGSILGIGYENKNLITLLVVGLLVGLVTTGHVSLFRSHWCLVGAALAAMIAAPNVIWQFQHHLPQVELANHIRRQSSEIDRGLIIFFQAAFVGVPLIGFALRGVALLWRRPQLRFIPVAYLSIVAIIIATGGKHYYAAGLLPAFLAAGSASGSTRFKQGRIDSAVAENSKRRNLHVRILLSGLVSAFIGLPLIPQSFIAASPVPGIYPDVLESIGWPSFVSQVGNVVVSLNPTDRANAFLLTRNYGEAGALDIFGRDLPPIRSVHNQYWLWGPPPETSASTEVVIAVGFDQDQLNEIFRTVRSAGHITMPDNIDSQEQHQTIFLCRNRRYRWSVVWSSLKNYS